MTFTYTGGAATDLERVRFRLQDTVSGSGPKPSNGNFTDEELNQLIADEGSNWRRAVAAGFEVLASAWRKYADLQVGPRREQYHLIADGYAADAQQWRDLYGRASTTTARTRWVTRVDGYSDDVSAGDV